MTQLSPKLPWELANPKWAQALNPILALPILAGNQINTVLVATGANVVVNHLLGRMPQGWFLVDNTANAVIWRTAPFTTTTITIQSSADTTISLYIY